MVDKILFEWNPTLKLVYYGRVYKRIDKNDELQFLDSSTLNHPLCLEIAEGTFGNKNISYEDLCNRISRKIGSRSTILSSLNNAIAKKNILLKKV